MRPRTARALSASLRSAAARSSCRPSIRIVSLTIVLTLWQFVGSGIDPVLFTTPTKVFAAAVTMIGSGELWNYLWPSLVVLGIGLTLAAVIGIATGLLLARFW